MLFKYTSINDRGEQKTGSIEALNKDVAISALQRRGLIISSVVEAEKGSFLENRITFFERIKNKDIVILSRQISTLFDAKVSALRVFRLLSGEAERPALRKVLSEVADDLQGGSSISKALAQHPDAFSIFYSNMVKAGEESGKLDETFLYLADYLDRVYETTSKVRSAMVYPAFIIITFVGVMILMLTTVIPNLSAILIESGQEVPLYTKVVLALSAFVVNYGIFFLIVVIIGCLFAWRYGLTEKGALAIDRTKLHIPIIGKLFMTLYLSRIADNMNTMLSAGIPMLHSIEITASVIDNKVYEHILLEAAKGIKGGSSMSDALSKYEEIPGILIAMIRVGEETGELGHILKILATFYEREVRNAVDALVSLIEPLLIIMLGLGVGFLLAAVLIPIYDIASGIS
ncbi:MAG: Uncharacterized protein Greene041614_886 [Parcubacteria group bacterium Greene0416_14]|nr:MAG: Uncharacterized protein Greene041614_886 [Parcubacteria group bacterium Greene0416_14]TSD01099.1 MAG: Uncharacterized protein Greene101415_502 [Parcubacteria group bacterium Greene1014_15]TSD07969.1 MAG: Uncharacterized protein Greene07144_550 [Parcubacteria group bacterium Greene0714_4]